MEVKLSKRYAKEVENLTSLRRKYGKAGDEIAGCLNVLRCADTLQELLQLPPSVNYRCHELHQNLRDRFSMDLIHPYRLLFRPVEPIPRRSDGGVDYLQVRGVFIEALYVNTHE